MTTEDDDKREWQLDVDEEELREAEGRVAAFNAHRLTGAPAAGEQARVEMADKKTTTLKVHLDPDVAQEGWDLMLAMSLDGEGPLQTVRRLVTESVSWRGEHARFSAMLAPLAHDDDGDASGTLERVLVETAEHLTEYEAMVKALDEAVPLTQTRKGPVDYVAIARSLVRRDQTAKPQLESYTNLCAQLKPHQQAGETFGAALNRILNRVPNQEDWDKAEQPSMYALLDGHLCVGETFRDGLTRILKDRATNKKEWAKAEAMLDQLRPHHDSAADDNQLGKTLERLLSELVDHRHVEERITTALVPLARGCTEEEHGEAYHETVEWLVKLANTIEPYRDEVLGEPLHTHQEALDSILDWSRQSWVQQNPGFVAALDPVLVDGDTYLETVTWLVELANRVEPFRDQHCRPRDSHMDALERILKRESALLGEIVSALDPVSKDGEGYADTAKRLASQNNMFNEDLHALRTALLPAVHELATPQDYVIAAETLCRIRDKHCAWSDLLLAYRRDLPPHEQSLTALEILHKVIGHAKRAAFTAGPTGGWEDQQKGQRVMAAMKRHVRNGEEPEGAVIRLLDEVAPLRNLRDDIHKLAESVREEDDDGPVYTLGRVVEAYKAAQHTPPFFDSMGKAHMLRLVERYEQLCAMGRGLKLAEGERTIEQAMGRAVSTFDKVNEYALFYKGRLDEVAERLDDLRNPGESDMAVLEAVIEAASDWELKRGKTKRKLKAARSELRELHDILEPARNGHPYREEPQTYAEIASQLVDNLLIQRERNEERVKEAEGLRRTAKVPHLLDEDEILGHFRRVLVPLARPDGEGTLTSILDRILDERAGVIAALGGWGGSTDLLAFDDGRPLGEQVRARIRAAGPPQDVSERMYFFDQAEALLRGHRLPQDALLIDVLKRVEQGYHRDPDTDTLKQIQSDLEEMTTGFRIPEDRTVYDTIRRSFDGLREVGEIITKAAKDMGVVVPKQTPEQPNGQG